MVKTALLYDNFCKTGNYVIYDVIIWVQDGNCKKMAQDNFGIGAFYNTRNRKHRRAAAKPAACAKPLML